MKVILITGASSGMGKVTALELVKKGYIVYAAARRTDRMSDIQENGGHVMEMDVTKESDITRVVDTIIQQQGKIDILWNNAGYGLYGAVEDVPLEEARKQFEVNLFGIASLTQKVLPHMRKAGSGTIINTSSMGGKMYMPLGAWYHATKHALEGWSDSLRLDVKPFGIHVVILEPGAIATEWGGIMMDNMLKYSGKGAYSEIAHKVARTNKALNEKGDVSDPSVISDTIIKIIEAKRPKTRYLVGKWAKPMVWMRLNLGDNMFDKMVMSQFK